MNYNIGQIIDDYTIIDLEKGANYSVNVIMRCNICGHIYKVRSSHIAEYKIKYPNAFMHSEKRCYNIQERYPIGTIYGDFSIIDYVKDKRKATNLVCKCNICANEIVLSPSTLVNVYSFSINHNITCNKIKYNGLAQLHPRLYNIWYSMTYRCTNQKCNCYDIYGGRGITTEYTKDLKGFPGFIQDMADSYYAHIQSLINAGFDESYAIKNTTIDRIDNNKGYYKDNIRWATARQQTQNRRCVIFFIAIDPDNTIYVSNNQLRFANNHNLSSCCISNCILNKSSTHKGWKFYRIDNINEYMLFTPNNLKYELY